jgi:glycosyltransferase involved in cell wall biosynthesis
MRRLAYDTWSLDSRRRHSGIYLYARRILETLSLHASEHGFEVLGYAAPAKKSPVDESSIAWKLGFGRSNDALSIPETECYHLVTTRLFSNSAIWRRGGNTLRARLDRADVYFCPSSEVQLAPGLPVVTTVHDLTPLTSPSFTSAANRRAKAMLRSAAKAATRIVTVSECSKADIVNYLGFPASRVDVIYLACDGAVFDSSPVSADALAAVRARFSLQRPYIMHLGTVQPRKNLQRLIEAYQMLMDRNPDLDLDLVLVGSLLWESEAILKAGKNVKEPARVIFTGVLEDNDMTTLLKGAELAVIPSLYEGFCLPMLESMACGVPTVASNNSCLPEVSGGVLRYFDPLSVDEIATVVGGVLQGQFTASATPRARIETRGRIQLGALRRGTSPGLPSRDRREVNLARKHRNSA